jgi:Rrf2 family protein
MLTASSRYAIRALLTLADVPQSEFITVKDLAIASKIPHAYLSKIIKTLAIHGIVITRKGGGGGVKLNRDLVTFYEVCEAFEDSLIVHKCLLSNVPCNPDKPCAFHHTWSKERERILNYLQNSKIERGTASSTSSAN